MRRQTTVAVGINLIVLSLVGCSRQSSEKSKGKPPGVQLVEKEGQELTADECKSKVSELLNQQDPKKIEAIPSSLRNGAFLVALAVSSGKLDAKCLDFPYVSD